MGTHPIFESDFDCLTEIVIMRTCTREIGFVPIAMTQVLSIAIAGSAISSTYLMQEYQIDCPTLQSALSYLSLALVYIPVYFLKGPENKLEILKQTWWKYCLLGLVDFEANYCIVKAYKYTSITPVQVCASKFSVKLQIFKGGTPV